MALNHSNYYEQQALNSLKKAEKGVISVTSIFIQEAQVYATLCLAAREAEK